MDFLHYFYSYAEEYDRATLLPALDGLLGSSRATLTAIPYGASRPPVQTFEGTYGNRKFSPLACGDGVHVFRGSYQPSWGKDKGKIIEGQFFVWEHPKLPNVNVVLTVESPEFADRVLVPFIETHRRRFYTALLSQEQLHMLLTDLQLKNQWTETRVARASMRSRFGKTGSSRERVISSVSWPNLGLEGSFELARRQSGWFRSLTFEGLRGLRVETEATLHRDGAVRSNRMASPLFHGLIMPICRIIAQNLEMFDKRSRREQPTLDVRPLSIDFRTDAFADIEERVRFIASMRQYPRSSVSVAHGNPYLQMSIIDYTDGSTFDLWVLNPRQLVVVPQVKGTIPAIRRLIGHVFDNFGEGLVQDFSEMAVQD